MRNIFYLFIVLLFMNACSMKTPPNDWQIQSSISFNSYTKNFLQGDDAIAKSDLKRAIAHAKSSADISSLARIYLGTCALNKSIGIIDTCHDYKMVEELTNDSSLKTYYAFLEMQHQDVDINLLPKQYKHFFKYISLKEYSKAISSIKDAPISSQLIAHSLIKEHLNEEQIENILDNASFYGYKKAVIYWLENLEKITTDENKKEISRKKILILTKE